MSKVVIFSNMTRLTRKNSNIDKLEIALDSTKVEKTSKLVASTSNINNQLIDVSHFFKITKGIFTEAMLGGGQ